MKRGLAVVASLLVAGSARAGTREDVAKRWAPVFHQEVRDEKDLYTAFEADGNWAADDNEETFASIPHTATVYFTVIETATHWFVQYMPYHASDTKLTNGHEHDTESVLAVVSKEGGGTGKLVAIETRFHLEWFVYSGGAGVKDGAKSIDGPIHADPKGHPQVYVQQVGHGICGGFSPPNDVFPDLQLQCKHGETPHVDGTGVVYRPDLPVTAPVVVKDQVVEVGYAMEEIATTFWAHRTEVGPGKTFASLVDFEGERCDVLACPKQFGGAFIGDRGESPSGPWNQEGGAGVGAVGSQFFDPAYTMSKRLSFPAPFSLDYCHNPYVGIAQKCADDAAKPATDAGPSEAASPSGGPAAPPAGGEAAADPGSASSEASGCTMSEVPTGSRRGVSSALFAAVVLVLARGRAARERRDGDAA